MTETGKRVLRAAAAPPHLVGAAARGGWRGRRRARVTAAPLAAVAVAGLLAGGTGARAGQAQPGPVPAGRGFTAYVVGTGAYPRGLAKEVTPINTATNPPGKPIIDIIMGRVKL